MAQHRGLGKSEFVIVFTGLGASVMNKMLKGTQINNKRLRFIVFFRSMEKVRKKGKTLDAYSSPGSIQHLHMAVEEQNTVHSYVGPTRLGFASEIEKD